MARCYLCPRMCGADRDEGELGFCGMPGKLYVARAALHMWEDPCISGNFGEEDTKRKTDGIMDNSEKLVDASKISGDKTSKNIPGSGTVFFSGCTLRCIYCQNYQIAAGKFGKIITMDRLTEIFLELQAKGAANINLVTPTHYTDQIIRALDKVKHKLHIPVVSNTSGYERVETLKMLDGYVDIYLTDFKYMNPDLAKKYSKAPDYPEMAKLALSEMVRQTGKPVFDNTGLMKSGVIVRHLLLPGQLLDSKRIVRYVYETYGDSVYLSLMNQYTPLPQVKDIPELNCKVKHKSYEKLIDFALNLGVTNAYTQSGEAISESFIPAFTGENV